MRSCVLTAVLAGCATSVPYPTTSPDQPCTVTIGETVPRDGATDHYWRSPLEFHLSEPTADVVVTADFEGVQSTRDDGHVVVFTPTQPLQPNTRYTASIETCRGTPSISFTTSGFGTPMEVPVGTLEGATWVVDIADARFPAGASLGDLVASLFSDRLLISLADVSGDQLVLRVALPREDSAVPQQDVCFRTLDLPAGVVSEAPFFEVAADDVVMDAYAGEIRLADLRLAGTLAPDGSVVGGGELSLTLDARDLVDALELLDEATLCDLSTNLGAPCEPCPDGTGTCVRVEVDGITALSVPGLVVEPVPEADVHPACLP